SVAPGTGCRGVGRSIGGEQNLESFRGVVEGQQIRDAVLDARAFVVSDDDDRGVWTRLLTDRRPTPEERPKANQRRVPNVDVKEKRDATPEEPFRGTQSETAQNESSVVGEVGHYGAREDPQEPHGE